MFATSSFFSIVSCSKFEAVTVPASHSLKTAIIPTGSYKVPYYAFDNGEPRLIDFAGEANVVVLFEAHEWRFVNSTKYNGREYVFDNAHYKSSDNISRFNQWAKIIGPSRTILGISAESQFKDLKRNTAAA